MHLVQEFNQSMPANSRFQLTSHSEGTDKWPPSLLISVQSPTIPTRKSTGLPRCVFCCGWLPVLVSSGTQPKCENNMSQFLPSLCRIALTVLRLLLSGITNNYIRVVVYVLYSWLLEVLDSWLYIVSIVAHCWTVLYSWLLEVLDSWLYIVSIVAHCWTVLYSWMLEVLDSWLCVVSIVAHCWTVLYSWLLEVLDSWLYIVSIVTHCFSHFYACKGLIQLTSGNPNKWHRVFGELGALPKIEFFRFMWVLLMEVVSTL
jgi:hypothetical protein